MIEVWEVKMGRDKDSPSQHYSWAVYSDRRGVEGMAQRWMARGCGDLME